MIMKMHTEEVDKYMAFYVEKENEWYVATDLETKVASRGKTAAEASSNLEEALELLDEESF